jgi:hypothetical protein
MAMYCRRYVIEEREDGRMEAALTTILLCALFVL